MTRDYCTWAPDKIFKWDLKAACDMHDEEYAKINKDGPFYNELRKAADMIFYDNLRSAGLPVVFAKIYYWAVRLFGRL